MAWVQFLSVCQGTVITAGKAQAVVVGTGPNTAIGKIRQGCALVHCCSALHAWCSDEKALSLLSDSQSINPAFEVGALCRDAMAETVEELTPLKQKLEDFGQFLSKVRCCPASSSANMSWCPDLKQCAGTRCWCAPCQVVFVCAGHCRHLPCGVADQHPSLQRPAAWRLGTPSPCWHAHHMCRLQLLPL